MTYILIILKVQVKLLSWFCNSIGLEKKVDLHSKKILHFYTIFKYRNISLNRDIFEAMHRYF